jgi:hypothetical protein
LEQFTRMDTGVLTPALHVRGWRFFASMPVGGGSGGGGCWEVFGGRSSGVVLPLAGFLALRAKNFMQLGEEKKVNS